MLGHPWEIAYLGSCQLEKILWGKYLKLFISIAFEYDEFSYDLHREIYFNPTWYGLNFFEQFATKTLYFLLSRSRDIYASSPKTISRESDISANYNQGEQNRKIKNIKFLIIFIFMQMPGIWPYCFLKTKKSTTILLN